MTGPRSGAYLVRADKARNRPWEAWDNKAFEYAGEGAWV